MPLEAALGDKCDAEIKVITTAKLPLDGFEQRAACFLGVCYKTRLCGAWKC